MKVTPENIIEIMPMPLHKVSTLSMSRLMKMAVLPNPELFTEKQYQITQVTTFVHSC